VAEWHSVTLVVYHYVWYCIWCNILHYHTEAVLESKYTKERLEKAVAESATWADVCRIFESSTHGSSQAHAKRMAVRHGVDFSHFASGRGGWNKGRISVNKRSPSDVLSRKDGSREHAYALRRALIESGVEYVCACCGLSEWMGNEITLQVDHIDGDPFNNIKGNLRFLCPNCHSQTSNYGVKNFKNRALVHKGRRKRESWIDMYTDDILRLIVKNSSSIGEVLDKLGRKNSPRNQAAVRRYVREQGLIIADRLSERKRKIVSCIMCSNAFPYKTGQKYCSVECYRSDLKSEKRRRAASVAQRKVPRPILDEVKKFVDKNGYCAAGRKYGVSDNAIRKWLKKGVQ